MTAQNKHTNKINHIVTLRVTTLFSIFLFLSRICHFFTKFIFHALLQISMLGKPAEDIAFVEAWGRCGILLVPLSDIPNNIE